MPQNVNPLKQFFRQPAIYLRLPSNGEYWPDGSLVLPVNKELPVFPMTAIDEITYRTPDALFNGQAVVNVIQSCIPNIKDGWKIPAIDVNSILMAIRIASYGHTMEVTTKCPQCGHEADYNLDIRPFLDKVQPGDFNKSIKEGDLEINFQPMDYYAQNQVNLQQFEQQKTIQVIQQSDIADSEKIQELNKALKKITEITMDALKWSISSIRTPNAIVTEPEFIQEFLTNCDRQTFVRIRDHIIELRESNEIPPLDLKCTECEHEYKQSMNMDQSGFFGAAS